MCGLTISLFPLIMQSRHIFRILEIYSKTSYLNYIEKLGMKNEESPEH